MKVIIISIQEKNVMQRISYILWVLKTGTAAGAADIIGAF